MCETITKITMIKGRNIVDEKNNNEYIVFESKLIENVNPIEYFQELFITSSFGMIHSFLKKSIDHYKFLVGEETIVKHSLKEASEKWKEYFDRIQTTEVPQVLLSAVTAKSKKEQVRLLKNATINSGILMSFIFQLWKKSGFKFSRYFAEHYPNGINESELPRSAYLKDGKIDKIGETKLSDGQIKQVIENRKVIVSNFFDNGERWCCLFITYDSLKGKEGWKNGTPHYHFISDKFGLSKEVVIRQLRSKEYKLGSLPHIEIQENHIN